MSQLKCKTIKKTDREVIYEVYCSAEVYNAETIIKNQSEMEIRITQISIHGL